MNPILILAGWQLLASAKENKERILVYDEALKYSRQVKKPLVVIGGPKGNTKAGIIFGKWAHGAGDLCIDINEEACGNANYLNADIKQIPLPDKYAGAVFVSHVLEHLNHKEDCIKAIQEITRIADRVYIVGPHKWNPFAWLHPDHKLWILVSENGIVIEQRK